MLCDIFKLRLTNLSRLPDRIVLVKVNKKHSLIFKSFISINGKYSYSKMTLQSKKKNAHTVCLTRRNKLFSFKKN